MSKIISVHSFRGGTGKSNTIADLAALLATNNKRVGVIDADIQSPGVHILFGLDVASLRYSLNDYLWGKCEIKQAAYEVSHRLESTTRVVFTLSPLALKPVRSPEYFEKATM